MFVEFYEPINDRSRSGDVERYDDLRTIFSRFLLDSQAGEMHDLKVVGAPAVTAESWDMHLRPGLSEEFPASVVRRARGERSALGERSGATGGVVEMAGRERKREARRGYSHGVAVYAGCKRVGRRMLTRPSRQVAGTGDAGAAWVE
jgi:hypothetical protein